MVKTKIVLEVTSEHLEHAVDLVEQLRLGYGNELYGKEYKIGTVTHIVEPDRPKEIR